MTKEFQRPEGALIEAAAKAARITARKGATRAGLSDARWRQIVSGYQSVGAGQKASVTGPADTIARMAAVVGVTAQQLRDAGREDAAELMPPESEVKAGRAKLGLSRRDMAELLGAGLKTVAEWEAGAPIPKPYLDRLRAILAETPDDVLLEEVRRRFQAG